VKADYLPYTTVVHHQNGAEGEALIDVADPLTNVYAIVAQVSYAMTEVEPPTTTGVGQTTTANGSATGGAQITELTAGSPLSGSDHLVSSSVTGEYATSASSLQTTSIGQGYMCIGAQNQELSSGQAISGGLRISRSHGKIVVFESAEFKAPLYTQLYASSLCPTPGIVDSSPLADYNIDLQNTGPGWNGRCSGSGTRISCDDSETLPSVQFATSSVSEHVTGAITISIHRLRASQSG
jgi:hypothetical protein